MKPASQWPDRFDVLVVGGGLAGASLACALKGSGLRIGLVEAVPLGDAAQDSYDERTTAISWGTRRLFEHLDLWHVMQPDAAPIRHLHVSQQGRFGTTRVSHGEYGVDALGYVLPNKSLGQALYGALSGEGSVTVITPARFESLTATDSELRVNISTQGREQPLRTRLLVGADGGRSAVRAALDLSSRVDDYEQQAIVTTVTPARPHADTAFERFCTGGPLAVLPRSADSCAVVWALPDDRAAQLLRAADDEFLDALQHSFGWRLGRLGQPGERKAYPLLRLICERPVTHRAVLVGNSAHHLHPAAAQGFNLALRDVMHLAALLRAAADAGGDPGEPELLRIWQEGRAPDQARVAGFTDAIVRLFSNDVPGLAAGRGLGLSLLDCLPGVKADMARRSMGLSMDWPALAIPAPAAADFAGKRA